MYEEIVSMNGHEYLLWYTNPYERQLAYRQLQEMSFNVNIYQKAGESGYAACDRAFNAMCVDSDCGHCGNVATVENSCVAICGDVFERAIPPGYIEPHPNFNKKCTCNCIP